VGRRRPALNPGHRLWAAIVDRLTFNGTIIETGTDPYRLAGRQQISRVGLLLPERCCGSVRRPAGFAERTLTSP
jgi:hypothetical protein